MSTTVSKRPMTTEELLALPEDGLDRELIRGQLREKPMTRRNRWHSRNERHELTAEPHLPGFRVKVARSFAS